MTTVGDQIFSLNQEVRKWKNQCERYEAALREIAARNGHALSGESPSAVAQSALQEQAPGHRSS